MHFVSCSRRPPERFRQKPSGLQQILLQQCCSRDPLAGGVKYGTPLRTCSVLGRRRDPWVGSCPTVSPTSSGGIHYHILWYRPKLAPRSPSTGFHPVFVGHPVPVLYNLVSTLQQSLIRPLNNVRPHNDTTGATVTHSHGHGTMPLLNPHSLKCHAVVVVAIHRTR